MKTKHTLTLVFSLVVALFSVGVAPRAHADLDRDEIRNAFRRHRNPSNDFPGLMRVESVEKLDLTKPLTESQLVEINDAILKAYGGSKIVRENLAHAMSKLQEQLNKTGLAATNTFFYLGFDAGYFIGFSGNVGIVFGTDSQTGRLAFYPTLFARIQAIDLGYDVHFGIGQVQGYSHVNGGFLIGGAYIVGAALGGSHGIDRPSREAWVEFKAGYKAQLGPYIEFKL